MQDNFEQFKKYFKPLKDHNMFNRIMVLKRHKDGIANNGSDYNRTIKCYYIDSLEEYEKYKEEIIALCEMFGGRAYIDLQSRDWEDFGLTLNNELAKRLSNHNCTHLDRIVARSAATCRGYFKHWIIDVDDMDLVPILEYLRENVQPDLPFGNERTTIYEQVKTANGYHIICAPFDRQEFEEKFPTVEIKTNDMTLLYYPKSLSEEIK